MEEEELAEERRVVSKLEVEEAGARRAPGRVTGRGTQRSGWLVVDRFIWIVAHYKEYKDDEVPRVGSPHRK